MIIGFKSGMYSIVARCIDKGTQEVVSAYRYITKRFTSIFTSRTSPDSGQLLVIACRKILYYLPRRLWRILRHLQNKILGLIGLGPPNFACKIFTHLTYEEKIALYRTALQLPLHCVVLEVGSYLGASAAVIGSAMRHRNGELHCVDTWENQAMDGPEHETWPEFEANTR